MAPLLFLSIQNRSGRKCSRMANSSALPFPIPSGGEDVVPLDEGIRFCGSLCTKSEAAERRTTETRRRKSSTRCFLRPGTLVFRNERSRCTKCTAASSIYYAFFGVASSKAKPTPPGSAPPTRRSPRRPAAPRPRGEARTACTSRAYIGRLGMRTVKVVPLPGMLST